EFAVRRQGVRCIGRSEPNSPMPLSHRAPTLTSSPAAQRGATEDAAQKKRGRGQVRVHGPSSRSVASTRRGGTGSIQIYITRQASQIVAEAKNGKTPAAGMELRGLSGASSETLRDINIGDLFDFDDYNPERFAWIAQIPIAIHRHRSKNFFDRL